MYYAAIYKVFIWHACSRLSLPLPLHLSLPIIQIHATRLYQASFMGNIDEVKELLEGEADVNEPNDVRKIGIDKINSASW